MVVDTGICSIKLPVLEHDSSGNVCWVLICMYSLKVAPLHEMAVSCVKFVQHKEWSGKSGLNSVFVLYWQFINNRLLVLWICLQGQFFKIFFI